MCAYVRACAGPTESTAEAVYAGHSIIASAGDVLQETVALERESVSILADGQTLPQESKPVAWYTFWRAPSKSIVPPASGGRRPRRGIAQNHRVPPRRIGQERRGFARLPPGWRWG